MGEDTLDEESRRSFSESERRPSSLPKHLKSDQGVPLPQPLRLPMPRELHRIQVTLGSGRFLCKVGEDRKAAEPWLQPDRLGHCPLKKRGVQFQPTADDPIDPFVVVRVFGGRLAGVGSTEDDVEDGSLWTSCRVDSNGLRPRWNETFVVLTSQPDLAILHFEVRTSGRKAVCYEAVSIVSGAIVSGAIVSGAIVSGEHREWCHREW